jgi:hypothetical protein
MTIEKEAIREVTLKQCIGCGATGAAADKIDHERYCPEVPPEENPGWSGVEQ